MVKMLKARGESLFHNSSKSNANLIFTGRVNFRKVKTIAIFLTNIRGNPQNCVFPQSAATLWRIQYLN